MAVTTVEPSGGVVDLIKQNTDERRWLLENPSEMLTKASLLMLWYPVAQVVWLDSHVVVFSTCGLQTARVVYCETLPLRTHCGCLRSVVRCSILLCRIYGWAVVIFVSLLVDYLLVTVRGLATVESPQPIAQEM